MIILIDGYNLIRQSDSLRRYERKTLEAGRRALIAKLIEYGRKRNHQITVVFDGIQNGWADEGRDREEGINIIYSRHGERADDVIKRMAAHTMEDIIVVSSDREIDSYVKKLGKTSLSSMDFETIINKVIYSPDNPVPENAPEDDNQQNFSKKKGPSRKLPRAQRRAQVKINKLE
jgi:predicted RNA-binding protein with PIN domain